MKYHAQHYSYTSVHVALAARSPAAFEALHSFKVLQLPSSTTLKAFTASNECPGEVDASVADECPKYDAHVAEHRNSGKLNYPLCQGTLLPVGYAV